jgi:membrane protease subunit HflC
MGVVLLLILVALNGYFILPEGKQAVVKQFGAPVGQPITEAGLHFKVPFIQDVTFFEKKILMWDGDPNQIPTNDKTYVYLDVTARWRIANALTFLQAVGNETRAQTILDDIIDGTVRDLVNKNNLIEIIRSSDYEESAIAPAGGEEVAAGAVAEEVLGDVPAFVTEKEELRFGRDKISAMIHEQASRITPQYGIELVDVLFKRVNYIDTVRVKVYERMISERKRIAAEKRSLGEGLKAEIMGKVDRELKEIVSEAERQAQEIRGRADAEAAGIYAAAYNRDPEFYSFYETLESYKKAVGSNTRLIISSDSPFYRYLEKIR